MRRAPRHDTYQQLLTQRLAKCQLCSCVGYCCWIARPARRLSACSSSSTAIAAAAAAASPAAAAVARPLADSMLPPALRLALLLPGTPIADAERRRRPRRPARPAGVAVVPLPLPSLLAAFRLLPRKVVRGRSGPGVAAVTVCWACPQVPRQHPLGKAGAQRGAACRPVQVSEWEGGARSSSAGQPPCTNAPSEQPASKGFLRAKKCDLTCLASLEPALLAAALTCSLLSCHRLLHA